MIFVLMITLWSAPVVNNKSTVQMEILNEVFFKTATMI